MIKATLIYSLALGALGLSACASAPKDKEPPTITLSGSIVKVTPVKIYSYPIGSAEEAYISTIRTSHQQSVEFLGRCEEAKIRNRYQSDVFVKLKYSWIGYDDGLEFKGTGAEKQISAYNGTKKDYPSLVMHSCELFPEVLVSTGT